MTGLASSQASTSPAFRSGGNIIFGVGSIAIGAEGADVAWQAHIGGFFAGLLLFSVFDPIPRDGRTVVPAAPRD